MNTTSRALTLRITFTAVLAVLALVSFIIESLFPPLFIPGARLGISNLFILLTIILLGVKEAYIVFLIKIILGSLFSGNISSIMYSLPAGLISLTVQILLTCRFNKSFSVLAISAVAAVINNVIQNVVYVLITKTVALFIYLPYLIILGFVAGLTVGACCYFILKLLPSNFTDKLIVVKGENNEGQKR